MSEPIYEVTEIPIDSVTTLFRNVGHYASGDLVEYEIRQASLDPCRNKIIYFQSIEIGSESARIIARQLAEWESES